MREIENPMVVDAYWPEYPHLSIEEEDDEGTGFSDPEDDWYDEMIVEEHSFNDGYADDTEYIDSVGWREANGRWL